MFHWLPLSWYPAPGYECHDCQHIVETCICHFCMDPIDFDAFRTLRDYHFWWNEGYCPTCWKELFA